MANDRHRGPRGGGGRFVVEPGRIDVFAGDSSSASLTRALTVTG